ncbi:MAG TPA: alpha/beta fold hydrolase [Baekduia sp.]|uniref:alpha/beta fold hydrolase n=1 Tax=Baekduia sp. TaxID=2600305 RepID=UPI002D795BC9|nr:alpha/beta fold hydrolase [Baekduia sp.]HET6506751.1 alpha/beta fold hydrolase [Baekduia sp.]
MPTLDTATGPVFYDERGAPGGAPIVLLPSGAHDHHDYDELRDRLDPARFRTIALDWPGHGASSAPTVPASATLFADVAQRLVEAVAPEGAVVVGNSVGGFSAARLAIRRPDLARGLVLIDSGGFAPRPPHVRAFCALMARPAFLRAIYPAFSASYMRCRTAADRRARATAIATTRADPGRRVVAEVWGSFAGPEHDLRADAPAIAAPTLVLHGRRDPVIPAKVARATAALIPGARLVAFDAGHQPHTSDPDGVAAEIVHHLDSIGHGQGQEAQGGTR